MDELDLGATIRGFSAGQKVFGRYTLKKILGRGGMGVVWLARDEKLDEEAALKFLPDVVKHDAAALDELKAETKRARRLTHAGIVRIHDFLEDSQAAAIAMEAVDGVTLAQFRIEQPGKIFEVTAIAAWVKQLCSALDYAHHTARVVHRDLKPANLMVDHAGRIKVTDFGIARSISDSVSRASNQAGSSGTPAYMSPQQMLGEKPAVTDDIYGLGATVYELLTGKPPFYSGNVLLQVQSKLPPAMAARRRELEISGAPIPPEWEAAIAACLAKDANARPQTVAAVAKTLGLDDGSLTGQNAPLVPTRLQDLDDGATVKLVPTAVPPVAKGGHSLRNLGVVAAVLVLGAAGYYFGIHVPGQRRIAAEQQQVRVAEENRQAEQRKADLAAQATRAAAEQKRLALEAEDKAYQDLSRQVLAFREAAPRAEFDSMQQTVETYLGAAPERHRPALTVEWEQKAKAWVAHEAANRPGSLTIETDPAGATVILYPANIRKTSPAVFKDLKPGELSYRVEKEGYEAQDLPVVVQPGAETKAGLVRLISLTGSAVITSNPAGAKVALDGNSRHFEGVTPFNQEGIPPGTYRATIQRADWRPVEKTLVVKRNESANLAADLHGVDLELRSDPPGAQVSLNGRAVGITPLQLTDQAPGEYEVAMSLAGFEAATKRLTADRRTEVSLGLLRIVPKVSNLLIYRPSHVIGFLGRPNIKISGTARGKIANGSYWKTELPAGEYDITLSQFGTSDSTAHVEITPGKTTYLEVSVVMSGFALQQASESTAKRLIPGLKMDATSPSTLDLAGESRK